jgi:sugar phosphate isomerase/epimerase
LNLANHCFSEYCLRVSGTASDHDELALSPTLAALLQRETDSPRAAMDRVAAMGFRAVQLSATHPGLRPRELDKTARRDLLAALRRRGLTPSGLDAWIPSDDFLDPQKVDRAVSALNAAIDLAADLGRAPLSIIGPDDASPMRSIIDGAQRQGVELADHRFPLAKLDSVGAGIDPATWLSHGADPASGVMESASRLVCARLCDLLQTGLRGSIGEPNGRLDVQKYRIALSVSGYSRPVVVDARQWSNTWAGLTQTQHHWATALG